MAYYDRMIGQYGIYLIVKHIQLYACKVHPQPVSGRFTPPMVII